MLFRSEVWIETSEPIDVAALASALGLGADAVRSVADHEYVITVALDPDAVSALAGHLATRGVTLAGLRSGRRSLEEAFLHITASGSEAGGRS